MKPKWDRHDKVWFCPRCDAEVEKTEKECWNCGIQFQKGFGVLDALILLTGMAIVASSLLFVREFTLPPSDKIEDYVEVEVQEDSAKTFESVYSSTGAKILKLYEWSEAEDFVNVDYNVEVSGYLSKVNEKSFEIEDNGNILECSMTDDFNSDWTLQRIKLGQTIRVTGTLDSLYSLQTEFYEVSYD